MSKLTYSNVILNVRALFFLLVMKCQMVLVIKSNGKSKSTTTNTKNSIANITL